ncbi:hypothetical protein BH11GEM1_BH11GEM1_08690 [soil metagenome]
MRPPFSGTVLERTLAQQEPHEEHIVFVTPAVPSSDAHPPEAVISPARVLSGRPGMVNGFSPDSGSPQTAEPEAPGATSATSATSAPVPSINPNDLSQRLMPPRQQREPWYPSPEPLNPFAPPRTRTPAGRDSVLQRLGAEVPEMAAHLAASPSEIDARAKEAMLKMRLSGRVLLVPPDNSGGLISSSIPFSRWFGAREVRARSARTAIAREENAARLVRLRARADSLMRSRSDSLPD